MKKKLVVFAVVATFVFGLLAGCGSNQAAQGNGDPAGTGQETTGKVENPEYTFYLVRHGQTLFNVRGVTQGWCDSPLTEEGITMAKKLGQSFASINFDKCYTSISERAFDTAKYIIGDRDISITIDENLKETNMGSIEGLEDPVPMIPDRLQKGWVEEGGETLQQTADRIVTAIDTIIKENPNGGTFLVTSHGGALTAYVDKLFSDTDLYKEFMSGQFHGAMPNCATTIVEYKDGQFTLKALADVSYLK